MRKALGTIKHFYQVERKIESALYMQKIVERREMFDALIFWVKVVYAEELKK